MILLNAVFLFFAFHWMHIALGCTRLPRGVGSFEAGSPGTSMLFNTLPPGKGMRCRA